MAQRERHGADLLAEGDCLGLGFGVTSTVIALATSRLSRILIVGLIDAHDLDVLGKDLGGWYSPTGFRC